MTTGACIQTDIPRQKASQQHHTSYTPPDRHQQSTMVIVSNTALVALEFKIMAVLKSRLYLVFFGLATFVLLFGAQIQELAFEKKQDIGFDVLFLITFCFLSIDTAMRAVVDPAYGLKRDPKMASKYEWQKSMRELNVKKQRTWVPHWFTEVKSWRLGSFLFWWDVLSVLTLCFDIDVLNFNDSLRETEISITVNSLGSPLSSPTSTAFGEGPFVFDPAIIIVILRTARLGKLVQSIASARFSSISELKTHLIRFFCLPVCCGELKEEKENVALIENLYCKYLEAKKQPDIFPKLKGRAPREASYRVIKGDKRSQVGQAMIELTARRVHLAVMLTLLITALFTYVETDASNAVVMVVLHSQSNNQNLVPLAVQSARTTSKNTLYQYQLCDGEVMQFFNDTDIENLRDREKLIIKVEQQGDRFLTGIENVPCTDDTFTQGYFSLKDQVKAEALLQILVTLFALIVWIAGARMFSSPVNSLVATPIERMVKLLGMLTSDPLGYQSSQKFKLFQSQEDDIVKKSGFSREALAGMETTFLTTTIHRIGSLMRVGFGNAGVEIIRDALTKDEKKDIDLSQPGSKVTSIFLFCDIRQFTDATEALQEEVFVFTNKIASVVHSICVAHGGSPNKNIGDAFLLSWQLDQKVGSTFHQSSWGKAISSTKLSDQYDKALLSVAKIVIELYDDQFYLEGMSSKAKQRLTGKLGERSGPLVQLGFGLNVGFALQGAIGSLKKIDATFISVDVDLSETLEGLTKRYGVSILMSDKFYKGLSVTCKNDVRLIDKLKIHVVDEYFENDDPYAFDENNDLDIYTYDLDAKAVYESIDLLSMRNADDDSSVGSRGFSSSTRKIERSNSKTSFGTRGNSPNLAKRRTSMNFFSVLNQEKSRRLVVSENENSEINQMRTRKVKVLPTEPIKYIPSVWKTGEIRKVREKFTDGVFFNKFHEGLTAYQHGDWQAAKQCFIELIDKYDDGPSTYFNQIILKNRGLVPRGFTGYGSV